MRYTSFILLLLFILAGTTLEAQRFTPNLVDSSGYKHGEWTEFKIPFELASGEVYIKFPEQDKEFYSLAKNKDRKYFPIIESVGEYCKGKKIGVWTDYYWNDSICNLIQYHDGVPQGEIKKFWINGQLKMEFNINSNDSIPVKYFNSQGNYLDTKLVDKIELIWDIYQRL